MAANLTAFDWQQNFFFVFSEQLNPGKITRGKDFPDGDLWLFLKLLHDLHQARKATKRSPHASKYFCRTVVESFSI
jgi:hypothetical protein